MKEQSGWWRTIRDSFSLTYTPSPGWKIRQCSILPVLHPLAGILQAIFLWRPEPPRQTPSEWPVYHHRFPVSTVVPTLSRFKFHLPPGFLLVCSHQADDQGVSSIGRSQNTNHETRKNRIESVRFLGICPSRSDQTQNTPEG